MAVVLTVADVLRRLVHPRFSLFSKTLRLSRVTLQALVYAKNCGNLFEQLVQIVVKAIGYGGGVIKRNNTKFDVVECLAEHLRRRADADKYAKVRVFIVRCGDEAFIGGPVDPL
jgi:hypothetical protein